jgi:hypothetical protein
MIEQMTTEDFLLIMEANRGVYPEYDNLSEEQKRNLANYNIMLGVAESHTDKGMLWGIGGIRYIGIGEAWFLTIPRKREPVLLKNVSMRFREIRDSKSLWRVYASSKISENFLEHLGFKREEGNMVWTRE